MYYLVSFSELRINMRKKIKLALITLSGLRKNPLLHVDCKTCDKIYFAFFKRFEWNHLFALQSCNVFNFDE